MAEDRSKRKAVSCSLAGANRQATARLIAFLTHARRQTAIKQAHQARKSVRENRALGDEEICRDRHNQIRTAALASCQNFSRRSLHRNGGERNFQRQTKPPV